MEKIKQKKEIKKFLLVVGILIAYCGFCIHSYGLQNGLSVTLLTWSFFVFCTPIADAGFLLDFPIRLITGFKMLYSEIIVWIIAALLNGYYLLFNSSIYDKTDLLKMFNQIITTPWPLWLIIVLSCIGTFASILFDDSIYDAAINKKQHKHAKLNQKKLLTTITIFLITILLYITLIKLTHLQITLL